MDVLHLERNVKNHKSGETSISEKLTHMSDQ